MEAAINELEIRLDILETNEPINRREGNIDQADALANASVKHPNGFSQLLYLLEGWRNSKIPSRNKWLTLDFGYGATIRLYVRCSTHLSPTKRGRRRYFDIAQIECAPTNGGLYTALFEWLCQELPGFGYDGLYIECVQPERFKAHLLSSGWVESPLNPDCFFWEFDNGRQANRQDAQPSVESQQRDSEGSV